MRVLLINANQNKTRIAVPIGICYIAKATKDAGYNVKVLDLCFEKNIPKKIKVMLEKFRPDIIGLSIRNIDTCSYLNVYEPLKDVKLIVEICKSLTDVPIILGGPAVSIMPKEILKYLECSYAIVGNAEGAFVELINRIVKNLSFSDIKGLAYFVDGELMFNSLSCDEEFGTLNISDWIDFNPYKRSGVAMPIQSKRGCALDCIHCVYNNIEGRSYRFRQPREIVDEIEDLAKNADVNFFEFVDSTFNVPQEHAKQICKELISRRVKAAFTTIGINPLGTSWELFQLMKEAGFNSIRITPDSASEKMLMNLKKGFTLDHLKKSAEYINKIGLISVWCFMIGGPGETEESIRETLKFAKKYLIGKKMIALFEFGVRIYPNTDLEKIAKAEAYISRDYNLLQPTFYISPSVDKNNIIPIINEAINSYPNFVLGAEQEYLGSNKYFQKSYNLLRFSPFCWQHIFKFLSLPLVSSLRHYRLKHIEKIYSEIKDIRKGIPAPCSRYRN